jgi:hypothetical protein
MSGAAETEMATEQDLRKRFTRIRALDLRAWSRLVGFAIDSEAFRIRQGRARKISALCDKAYIELQEARG